MTRLIGILLVVVLAVGGWMFWSSRSSVEALTGTLEDAYAAKLANADYVAWKSQSGIPTTYQAFPEEEAIKSARSLLASRVSAPEGVVSVRVPTSVTGVPNVDGRIDEGEWDRAVAIPIGIDGSDTRLRLVADGKHLYLACDVPGDTTGKGYDQFRFYFHAALTPLIDNERIHVRPGKKDRLGGIRQTNVRWSGQPPTSDDERWMKYPISDWRIFQKARGRSSIREHREYEAVLDLEEAGLHPGVPFSAFVEVETDPALNEKGKFDHRVYLGEYGTQGSPKWLVIEKPEV